MPKKTSTKIKSTKVKKIKTGGIRKSFGSTKVIRGTRSRAPIQRESIYTDTEEDSESN